MVSLGRLACSLPEALHVMNIGDVGFNIPPPRCHVVRIKRFPAYHIAKMLVQSLPDRFN
jgi:hypothetical protein